MGDGSDEIDSKINHYFNKVVWMDKFSDSYVRFMEEWIFDNTPLVLHGELEENKRRERPFKVFNCLANHIDFDNIFPSSKCSKGCQMMCMMFALGLRMWNEGHKKLYTKSFKGAKI